LEAVADLTPEPVWTLLDTLGKFPSANSGTEELSPPKGTKLQTWQQDHTKTEVVVAIARIVPVTIGAATIPGVVVPRTTTLHPGMPVPSPALSQTRENRILLQNNSKSRKIPKKVEKVGRADLRGTRHRKLGSTTGPKNNQSCHPPETRLAKNRVSTTQKPGWQKTGFLKSLGGDRIRTENLSYRVGYTPQVG